jgi:hypothetical protein
VFIWGWWVLSNFWSCWIVSFSYCTSVRHFSHTHTHTKPRSHVDNFFLIALTVILVLIWVFLQLHLDSNTTQ